MLGSHHEDALRPAALDEAVGNVKRKDEPCASTRHVEGRATCAKALGHGARLRGKQVVARGSRADNEVKLGCVDA